MSDDYKIQLNTHINGNLVNIRANDVSELAGLVGELAEGAPTIFKDLGDAAQAALAHGVFTGNATGAPGTPAGASSGPPAGGIPSCPAHGEMKDMRGKRNKSGEPYKNRFYCKKFGCKDSQGQGDWIE